jgi:DNA-binding response OmpR family regulator
MNQSQTILVIDDDEKFSFGLVSILRRNGYQVVTASNGVQGLEKIRAIKPDIILCDVMMPPPNGIQLKKELAGDPAASRIPFFFLTARTSTADKVAGLENKADDYITKPFDVNELLARIESVQRREELGRQRGIKEMTFALDQLRDSISVNLSNEIHAPITVLLTTLELVLREKFTDHESDLTNYLQKANSSARRIKFLVEDLEMLNKIDKGSLNTRREDISHNHLATLIRQTVEVWETKKQDIQMEIDPGLIVCAPRSEFFHVISHVVNNACKFSPRRGKIKISIREYGLRGCIFEVVDEGDGIPLDYREKVFERYYQINKGEGFGFGGLGIGLTLARAFAQSLGGDVQIMDSRVGCRTRMVIPQCRPE